MTGWDNSTVAQPPPEELFESVKLWVEKNGGIVHPSLMYTSGAETESGSAGLVVSDDCKAGETLYRIPHGLWLMSHMVLFSTFGSRGACERVVWDISVECLQFDVRAGADDSRGLQHRPGQAGGIKTRWYMGAGGSDCV